MAASACIALAGCLCCCLVGAVFAMWVLLVSACDMCLLNVCVGIVGSHQLLATLTALHIM